MDVRGDGDTVLGTGTDRYRADYEPLAIHIVPITSLGLVATAPRQFDHQQITRPKYPIDEMADADYPNRD